MKGDTGQLPHHFVGTEPYYLALSGETQTGPNTFWVKTALRYAAVTGDIEWLREYLPTLRKAAQFVFGLIDPEVNLVFAPGSLMIDVFIRNNYTADSNAMVVGFIRDFAEAERLVGSADRAAELEATALRVIEAVNNKLWAAPEAGSDHYITQLNKDGSTRDFVDYGDMLASVFEFVYNCCFSNPSRKIRILVVLRFDVDFKLSLLSQLLLLILRALTLPFSPVFDAQTPT